MQPPTVHNYFFTFSFEDSFNSEDYRKWMRQNWTSSIYFAVIYVIVIFGIRNFMEGREKFELRTPLVLWNAGLAILSVMGAMRAVAETVTMLTYDGFYHTICNASFPERHNVSVFWCWVMTLCKLLELGDTVFVVLRKQPLIFLHWYHHVTVLIYTWMSFPELPSTGRWFVLMNFTVHAIMYSYYALKAMKLNPPKRVAMVITSLQLVQMVMGCYVNIKARQYIQNGVECNSSIMNVNLALMLYASYFILFAKFFYQAYFSGNNDKTHISKEKSK